MGCEPGSTQVFCSCCVELCNQHGFLCVLVWASTWGLSLCSALPSILLMGLTSLTLAPDTGRRWGGREEESTRPGIYGASPSPPSDRLTAWQFSCFNPHLASTHSVGTTVRQPQVALPCRWYAILGSSHFHHLVALFPVSPTSSSSSQFSIPENFTILIGQLN